MRRAERLQRRVHLIADARVVELEPLGILQHELLDPGAVQERHPGDLALVAVLGLHGLRDDADDAPRELPWRLDAHRRALQGADQGRQAVQVVLGERQRGEGLRRARLPRQGRRRRPGSVDHDQALEDVVDLIEARPQVEGRVARVDLSRVFEVTDAARPEQDAFEGEVGAERRNGGKERGR